ncbi:unnamed protein product [Leuciscus chuanchicus]
MKHTEDPEEQRDLMDENEESEELSEVEEESEELSEVEEESEELSEVEEEHHGLCKKAHWGKCILAQVPGPAVSQGVRVEGPLGQGVKPLAMGRVWRGKQFYLCDSKDTPNQLDRLGMESPFSWQGRLP